MKVKGIGEDELPGARYLTMLAAGVVASATFVAATGGALAAGLGDTLRPAKPLEPSAAIIKEVVEARKRFGFRHDEDYVRELLTHPERFGAVSGAITGGHYATPAEAKELETRLRVQDDALRMVRDLREDPTFGGMHVDKDGVLNIGFTRDTRAKTRELLRKVDVPERIRFFTARRSLADLETQKREIVDALDELRAKGIEVSEVGVTVADNIVRVGVVDLDAKKRAVIISRFGSVDVFEKTLDELDLRSDTADPMRAGVSITNQSNGTCTSNWKARDRDTGDLVMLTAGHCAVDVDGTLGGPGTVVFQGVNDDLSPRKVGVSDQTTWTFPVINIVTGARSGAAPVDAMRVPFLSGIASLPWLYAYDDGNSGVFANGEEAPVGGADGTVVVGTAVCSAGQFSPGNQVGGGDFKNCGTVSSVNVARTFVRQTGSPDRFVLQNANIADYVAIGGDSGAPIWRLEYDDSSGWEAIAVGHHSGGPTGSEIFNDVDRVEDALNVDIVHF